MLRCRLFSNNQRLNAAAINAPAMRRDEPDKAAVRLLQQALRDLDVASMRQSIGSDGVFDGDYGGETFRAVKKYQRENSIGGATGTGDGIAGRNTIELMDSALVRSHIVPQTAAIAALAPPPVETPSTLRRSGVPRLPTATRLGQEYLAFVDVRGKPCRRGITHQCAIRMTIALGRCDIGFELNAARPGDLYVHRAGSGICGGHIDTAHDASAGRVFRYIRRFWTFRSFDLNKDLTGRSVYERIKGSPAIIFFHKLSIGGNHIDFFNGDRIMNDQLNYAAPGEPRSRRKDSTFYATQRAIHVLTIPR